ncbi:MAG TPA: tetratricopeptide repeat protein [Verrucomicrobiae bacterium]
MKKKYLRPVITLVAVVASLVAFYVVSWRFDPARLEHRAAKGQPEAQYRLGKAYFDGYVVGKDNRMAVAWLAKAAAQGHLKAQAGLALMYAKGLGVRQDYQRAADWYGKAAAQGSVLAQNQLGVLYAQGRGVQRDLNVALKFFNQAADQGSQTARQNLMLTSAARSGKSLRVESKGRVYPAVTVVKVEPEAITVAFEPEPGGLGLARIRFSDLPADLQQRFGHQPSRWRAGDTGQTRLASLPVQPL